ncbi:hypothetical protein IU418_29935, partial [Nocardia farcinica]|uniref:hypothetical protein n=1 Tax=Nocardia farcinica TaxID=37329 RepID=UPI001B3C6EA5
STANKAGFGISRLNQIIQTRTKPGPKVQTGLFAFFDDLTLDQQRSNDQNLWIPGGRAFPEDDRRSHRILIKTSVGALAGRHARA